MKSLPTKTLEILHKEKIFSPLDFHFARFIRNISDDATGEIALAAGFVSYFKSKGHICFDLARFADFEMPQEIADAKISFPAPNVWAKKLRQSLTVGQPGDFRPLILDSGNRLYLHRYWDYENSLAEQILSRLESIPVDEPLLRAGLNRLFPTQDGTLFDWQQLAAFIAVTKKFCVISGGPGTGKTSTIVKILAMLLEQNSEAKIRIALVAPTGKAATRLEESIQSSGNKLNCADLIKSRLPSSASTIHRLLGARPGTASFKHHSGNLLPIDALIVDEASMVDLALMAKLFQAVPPSARIILLGDKDQLSSVEAGAVLAEICGVKESNLFSKNLSEDFTRITGNKIPTENIANEKAKIKDCVVELRQNFRFGNDSGIYRFSEAARESNVTKAETILGLNLNDVSLTSLPAPANLSESLRGLAIDGFKNYLSAQTPEEALARIGDFKILSVLRDGPFGVVRLNEIVASILSAAGLFQTNCDWYFRRPIMILRNDYNLGLFNGDVGVIFTDETGAMRAFFVGENNTTRSFIPARLPEHETVFAMTVHKSQGSEFGKILLILPERDTPVLTRELIYTGLTRAREKVTIWSNNKTFANAISRQVYRHSGLGERLYGHS